MMLYIESVGKEELRTIKQMRQNFEFEVWRLGNITEQEKFWYLDEKGQSLIVCQRIDFAIDWTGADVGANKMGNFLPQK